MPRICRGRQKLQMVKMENETNLQVTFSKRRAGLFKKASELSTLCGTELGLIVFSPGKKAFCFGHPSIEEVLDKYEGRPSRQPLNHDMQQIIEACSHATLNELNAELTQVMERIERERKRGEELTQLLKASQAECGLEGPVEELDLDKMEILRASLIELRSKVADQAKQKLAAAKTANPPHNPNFYVGTSSSSAAAQSANPAHNNFFVGSSSSSAAAGPSGLQGLANPEINNVGFNFNGNDFVMQAPPDQPNNVGFNGDPMFLSDWNPNLGGGFL
ncbi:agamous-like MADS-box protein AGL62 [Prunus avium]|uniref:Agamous-like MADS-box protein AGL62 n=1 Tax=Prunus avium TaxID=42229 RepID=A0A6P5SL26_PRUAV|nr:agamous-like MADS-box protein AGL62 [Prunus avium]